MEDGTLDVGGDILQLIKDHEGEIKSERSRLDLLRDYIRGSHPLPFKPHGVGKQYEILVDRATTNLLPMIRNASLHQLFVDGITTGNTDLNNKVWSIFQANEFDMRQTQVFSSALDNGASYMTVRQGVLKGEQIPVIRGYSARRMFTLYEDPVVDDFPEYAFILDKWAKVVEVWDSSSIYTIGWAKNPDGKPNPQITAVESHGSSVCPVVRFAPMQDLDGRCSGEIEPLLQLQDRVNQVSFDLLIVQHYGAFTIQGASGVSIAKNPDGTDSPIPIRPDKFMLFPDPDSKAWQLPGSPLDGYIAAFDLAVHHLAVASQTPAHYLLGKMTNLSAEALAAAETTLTRKVSAYKKTLGESVEKVGRLAATLAGLEDLPEDAEVVWADRESRSLSQIADALTKYQSLGVPEQAIWAMMPGVTQSQVDDWTKLKSEQDPANMLAKEIANNGSSSSRYTSPSPGGSDPVTA